MDITINNLTGIVFAFNGYITENKRENFLVLENNYEIECIFNLSNGEEYRLNCYRDVLFDDKTILDVIYENDFKCNFDFGLTKEIIYYRNVDLRNSFNGTFIAYSDFLKFTDVNNNSFYVDIRNDEIYFNFGYYDVKFDKASKSKYIFKKGEACKVKKNEFRNLKADILNLFFEYREE